MTPFLFFWCEPIVKAPILVLPFDLNCHTQDFFGVGGCFHSRSNRLDAVCSNKENYKLLLVDSWVSRAEGLDPGTHLIKLVLLCYVVKSWLVGIDIFENHQWYSIIIHVKLSNLAGREITTWIKEAICIFHKDASALPFGASALSCGGVMGLIFATVSDAVTSTNYFIWMRCQLLLNFCTLIL
jgi:hypothetical protein